jgi:hypothetical protein
MTTIPQYDEQAWLERRQGAEDARRCKEVCLHSAEILLGRSSDGKSFAGLIRTLEDCAQINQLAENYLLRGSQQVGIACTTASEICLACAQQCERYSQDSVLSECAQTCRKTMENLRRIGSVGA